MASIYHIFCDATSVVTQILEENKRCEYAQEQINSAALLIQKHGRGCLARKKCQRLHGAAIIIQKNSRRFLVKINMLFHILNQIDKRNLLFYDKMATKIQALWRGYKCRQVNRQIFLLREMQRLAKENKKYMKRAKELKKRMEEEEIMARENESKKMVLFILFKLHHLLRTNTKPGILSDMETTELSWMEQLLKSLRFTTYMKELKKVYYNTYHEPTEGPFILEGRYRKCEKAYYQKYTGDDLNPVQSYTGFSQEERFSFKKRADLPYIPVITNGTRIKHITRDIDSRYNISKHDFDTTMRKVNIKKIVPEYFIDFWNKMSEIYEIPEK